MHEISGGSIIDFDGESISLISLVAAIIIILSSLLFHSSHFLLHRINNPFAIAPSKYCHRIATELLLYSLVPIKQHHERHRHRRRR
jgi:hypothetical protein